MYERVRLFLMVVFLLATSSGIANAADLIAGLQVLAPGLTTSVVTEFNEIANGNTGSWACDGSRGIPSATQFGTAFYCEATLPHPWSSGVGADALGNLYQIVVGRGVVERNSPLGAEDILHFGCIPFVDDDGVTRYRATVPLNLAVDGINGNLYIALGTQTFNNSYCQGTPTETRGGIVRIAGLPTLLDIFLSYQPPAALSFNVPVRPEGLTTADSFNIYTGDLATLSDLSQARPLACRVPTGRQPEPGEHFTVADTTTAPLSGHGRYYLVEVSYQGQKRAGRQMLGGSLQGRNAAALPVCQ